jgi:hypothetical protein
LRTFAAGSLQSEAIGAAVEIKTVSCTGDSSDGAWVGVQAMSNAAARMYDVTRIRTDIKRGDPSEVVQRVPRESGVRHPARDLAHGPG